MDRAPLLRYPASRLVTKLVDKYRRAANVRTVLFPSEVDDVAEALRWVKKQSGWENVTPATLSWLRWQALHEVTGGELASSCLILGLRAHLASVELHYSVLEVTEAREKFDESSEILWGERASAIGPLIPPDPPVVGARGVPKVSLVQETVGRLQAASKVFFAISPRAFDPLLHGNLLNAAVLYATWHQFFCFATRAIRNAYQARSLFALDNQIAILGDKDFEDHHKTRLIWAHKTSPQAHGGHRRAARSHTFAPESTAVFRRTRRSSSWMTTVRSASLRRQLKINWEPTFLSRSMHPGS